jgi:glycosyltransferase involved in cell wall biosynthesis
VSSTDLEQQFHSPLYKAHPVLTPLRHRSTYICCLTWITSRLLHYPLREMAFLRWLRGRPDIAVVHLQQWTLWLAAPFVRRIRAMGKRVVFTVHNVVPHKYPRFVPRALVQHWIRSACVECDGLFVHTEALAEELSRFLGRPHPPIHVSPHGVWSTPQNGAADTRPPLEQRLALKRLLFFGAIRRNKGLDLLLSAAAQLPEYRITIAGDAVDSVYFTQCVAPMVKQLEAAGVQVDLQDHFVPEEELPGLFAAHSAVVLPYTADFVAQSGVVFLALAHELPVVASEAGGLASLMRRFGIGVTFDRHTADALAAAVRELHEVRDPAALARQIHAAREDHSWATSASATIHGYRVALDTQMEMNDSAIRTSAAC